MPNSENISNRKLGKLAPRVDARVPLLAHYMRALPPPPPRVVWTKGLTSFGMMENDKLGCCTAAAVAHMYQIWTANARKLWTPSDADVVKFYSDSTGYIPGKPETDKGGVEVDVLTYLLKNGFDGRHIAGFGSIDVSNETAIKQAIHLFGGVYVGIQLPISAQTQAVWDVPATGSSVGPGKAGSWGGHAVAIVSYGNAGLTCVTWGMLQKMTWAFFHSYCDEAYSILAAAWIKDKKAPNGFDYDALEADLVALKVG